MSSKSKRLFTDRNLTYLYWGSGLILMFFMFFLLPIDDDWFFLRYSQNPSQWGIPAYHWLGNCILLMRGYWRPMEDLLLTYEFRYAPWLFPYLQHFIIVLLVYGSGWSVRCLGIKTGVSNRCMLIIVTIGVVAATNFGAITSIDSMTQVSAAFWGLLSARVFISKLRIRYFIWIVCCILSCLSKETGFILIFTGPLIAIIIDNSNIRVYKIKKYIIGLITAILLTFGYLGAYFGMKLYIQSNEIPETNENIIIESYENDYKIDEQEWFSSEKSHQLTPITLIKNIGILYCLGLYPVAVNGIYYNNFIIVIITILIGWGGIILLYRMIRRAPIVQKRKALMFALLGIFVSLPSLITRAGEISPFNSNMFFIIAIGQIANQYKFRSFDYFLALLFIICTLTTDVYKYSLAYRGGRIGHEMAENIVRETPPNAKKIIWIGVDESKRDKSGAAYTMSPYRAFDSGSAAIALMNYPDDINLTRYYIQDKGNTSERIDSISQKLLTRFDCIWITSGKKTKVIVNSP